MKTILYLNKKYCTRFSDLKSIIKGAVANNDEGTMIELLISFRDQILEKWLTEISQIDPATSGISEQIQQIHTEATDSEIIQKLSNVICSSSFELELNPLEYIELQDQVEINSGYGKLTQKLGDMLSFPDIVKSFTITFFIKVTKSKNDNISIKINGNINTISLCEKNKIYRLSCSIDRAEDCSFPSVSIMTGNCMLGSFSVLNFVDLGLDVKWACCNLGAKSIYSEGNYYAWGELSPKKVYSEDSYCGNKSIQDIAGHKAYDAATVALGENWKIPNKRQWQQLISKCIWTYVCDKEKKGFWVKSKTTFNRIFIPLTGCKHNDQQLERNNCYCWTSIKDDINDSFALCCSSCGKGITPSPTIVYQNKIVGITIRPVFIK